MIIFFNKLFFLSMFNRFNDELKLLIKVLFLFIFDQLYIYMYLKDVFYYMYEYYLDIIFYVLFIIFIIFQGKIMIRMVVVFDLGCV